MSIRIDYLEMNIVFSVKKWQYKSDPWKRLYCEIENSNTFIWSWVRTFRLNLVDYRLYRLHQGTYYYFLRIWFLILFIEWIVEVSKIEIINLLGIKFNHHTSVQTVTNILHPLTNSSDLNKRQYQCASYLNYLIYLSFKVIPIV